MGVGIALDRIQLDCFGLLILLMVSEQILDDPMVFHISGFLSIVNPILNLISKGLLELVVINGQFLELVLLESSSLLAISLSPSLYVVLP